MEQPLWSSTTDCGNTWKSWKTLKPNFNDSYMIWYDPPLRPDPTSQCMQANYIWKSQSQK
jgi:hypothetical protein